MKTPDTIKSDRKKTADAITDIIREAAKLTGCKSPYDAYNGEKYQPATTCRHVAVAMCAERLGMSDAQLAEVFRYSQPRNARNARVKGEAFLARNITANIR